jgi:YesN/AraC family two-component response regulator
MVNLVIKRLIIQQKIWILKPNSSSKLIEDLESVQAELESREDVLIKQEDLYIASKEALALERSEVASLCKALAKEQEDHALTKKANIALNEKYCDLNEKHKELELQYNLLWKSTPHPSKAKDASTPSTSQGCEKCYNLDMNIYATNLANMEAMKKEIAR